MPRQPSSGWVMVRVGEGDENGNGAMHASCCHRADAEQGDDEDVDVGEHKGENEGKTARHAQSCACCAVLSARLELRGWGREREGEGGREGEREGENAEGEMAQCVQTRVVLSPSCGDGEGTERAGMREQRHDVHVVPSLSREGWGKEQEGG